MFTRIGSLAFSTTLTLLVLSACGLNQDGSGLRPDLGTVSLGNPGQLSELATTGQFGCTAESSVATVASGQSFSVTVTPYNAPATGTVTLPGIASTNTGGVLTFNTSYNITGGSDVIYRPTLRISDGTSSATCQFQVYVTAPSGRVL